MSLNFTQRADELRVELLDDFCQFIEEKWQADPEFQEKKSKKEQQAFLDGWNAAIASIEGAAQAYLEDNA